MKHTIVEFNGSYQKIDTLMQIPETWDLDNICLEHGALFVNEHDTYSSSVSWKIIRKENDSFLSEETNYYI